MSLSFLPFSQSSKEVGDDVLEVLQVVSTTRKVLVHESSLCANYNYINLASQLEKAETILKGLWLKVMTEDLEGLVLTSLVKMKLTDVKSEEPGPGSDHESEEETEDSEVVKTEDMAV